MKIALGCDHGGYEYKEKIKEHLLKEGYEVIDCGTNSTASCNYPEFAFLASEKIKNNEADKGILVCSSGEGIAIAANKVKGIRCGIGYDDTVSRLIVEHNHANMIAFGALYMNIDDVLKRVDIFLNAKELDGRHQNRVNMIIDYENK